MNTTHGTIMMNIGEIDIGGLGLHNKTWLWSPVRDDEVHTHDAAQRTHSCSVLLFFSGNIALGIGVFDVLHIISTCATLRVCHSTGGGFRVSKRLF